MWLPTDDGFMAHENLMTSAAAAANASAAAVVAAAVNSTDPATSLRSVPSWDDDDTNIAIGFAVATLTIWLVLCGICRFYICCPCPCCFCYIPCCCGFCLAKDKDCELRDKPSSHSHYHHYNNVLFYPRAPDPSQRYHRSRVPAFPSHAVDMEEPLLSAPTYTHPPSFEASPPAYHDVPSAPPLS